MADSHTTDNTLYQLYRVHWCRRDRAGNGRMGPAMLMMSAQAWADQANEMWPDRIHWIEPEDQSHVE